MVFSTSCRATSNLCRGCVAGQSRGLQTLNRGILHSPVEARPDELAQIRAAAAAENLRQICRGASPPLYHHREGGEDFHVFLFEIFAFQLAPIGGNESTVGLVVQICRNLLGGGRSLCPAASSFLTSAHQSTIS